MIILPNNESNFNKLLTHPLEDQLFNCQVTIADPLDFYPLRDHVLAALQFFIDAWEGTRPPSFLDNIRWLLMFVLFLMEDKIGRRRFEKFLVKKYGDWE